MTRASFALFLAGFSTFSLLYCVQPLFPLFTQEFGVSPAASSLALSLSTGGLSVAIMLAAALSEGVGRKSLMFVSLGMAGLLDLVAAAAPDWRLLLAIRTLEGFVLGGVPAVAMAYLAEEIEPGKLGRAMGLYVGGNAVGGMSGRFLAGVIAGWESWRVALGVVGVLALAAAAGFVWLLPPSRNFVRRPGFSASYHLAAWGRHLRDPAMLLLFAIGALAMGAFVTVYNFAAFRLLAPPYSLDQTALGLVFVTYLFGIAASTAAGALSDRIGRRAVLPAGVLVALAGVAITWASPLAIVIAGIALLTAGFFVAHSVASAWVGRRAVVAKGHASSLYLLSYYLGSSMLGSAGGWAWAQGAWDGVAAYAGALLLAALASSVALRRVAPLRVVERQHDA